MENIKSYITKHANSGFTLIEILVSVGVLAIISGVAISIFVTVSATYDKANVIKLLNSEGNRVMEQMSRAVRNSVDATEISSTVLRLRIPEQSENIEYMSNGQCTEVELYMESDTIKKRAITSTCANLANAPCTQAVPCTLTNVNVQVTSIDFSVMSGSSSPDRVAIAMSVRQNPSLSNPDPEQQASVDFTLTVSTRGY